MKLIDRALDFLAGFAPCHRALLKTNSRLEACHRVLMNDRDQDRQQYEAQLVQLRIQNRDPGGLGRIGWEISTFIPQAAVDAAKADPGVSLVLLERAVRSAMKSALTGVFKLSSYGSAQAILFNPLSPTSGLRPIATWFEADRNAPSLIYKAGDEQLAREATKNQISDTKNPSDTEKFLQTESNWSQ